MAFEGHANEIASNPMEVDFKCDEGDSRVVRKEELYKIGIPFALNDKVWLLRPGTVTAKGDEKSFVVFDDGDEANLPNSWIHKQVLGTAATTPSLVRFDGSDGCESSLTNGNKEVLDSNASNAPSARFDGSALIHWDNYTAFEGHANEIASNPMEVDFKCHDGDSRIVRKEELYKIGMPFALNDKVCAYYTHNDKYLCPGTVTAIGDEESYVVFYDGDEASLPNRWIHKQVLDPVANTSPSARFDGSALIHWDQNLFCEGHAVEFVQAVDFKCHKGGSRRLNKEEVYKIGIPAALNDKVWAYYTSNNEYLCPGTVTAKGDEKSYVVFDDGDEANLPNSWIHKQVRDVDDLILTLSVERSSGEHMATFRSIAGEEVYRMGIPSGGTLPNCLWNDVRKAAEVPHGAAIMVLLPDGRAVSDLPPGTTLQEIGGS